ncbi:MAG TPA: rod shape-determining protein MreC [Candidatus Binatia bacterium]|jgi:rod shape-determining protein MreC
MFVFLRKYQVPVSSCFCVFLSIYILTAAARGHLKSDPVGPALLWILRPLQLMSQTAIGWIKGVQESHLTLEGYKVENERLRQKIAELEKERNRLLEAEATNRRLQQLLEFRSQMPSSGITASIIAASASSWFKSCLLDKGSTDGIRRGMAVVTPLGALGRVIELFPHTAKVLLITDPNSGVDVIVQRTRARGIVSGSLENGPVMKYVKHSEDVQVGDRLVTSGLDGVFPRGMMVATVTTVRKQTAGLFQQIGVMPAVTLERTEQVLVVNALQTREGK